jgi:hypothetical protein
LAALCFVLILAAMQPRAADDEMVAIIEEERSRARRVAMNELAWLAPAIILGLGAYWLTSPPARGAIPTLHGHAAPRQIWSADSFDWGDLFQVPVPWYGRALAGALGGLTGLIGGATLGWGVRIFFTLVFGKEAYGTGDIYLMAAIGAVGGFWMCLIAFFAASLLALFGVVASLLRKSCRALPFGPWLAMGALVAMWVRDPVFDRIQPALSAVWALLHGRAPGEL